MARSRNIKPGFFTNDDLVELDFATRLLFAGLWTIADREGRLQDRPKKIKIDLFPADNVDVDAMLQSLHDSKFIVRYAVDGVRFIQIQNWGKHQNPHYAEKPSEIPDINGKLPEKPQALPRQDSDKTGINRADSLLLIPDSLIPDSKKGERAKAPPRPDDVAEQVWQDWQQLRKAKRAPVTQTVIDGARSESGKAGMPLEDFLRAWCRRGSQGLEAAWLKPEERAGPPGETVYQRSMREKWEVATGRNKKPITEVEDVTAIALG